MRKTYNGLNYAKPSTEVYTQTLENHQQQLVKAIEKRYRKAARRLVIKEKNETQEAHDIHG